MKKLIVKTPIPYPVYIGDGLIAQIPKYLKDFKNKNAFIIADGKLKKSRVLLIKTLKNAGWTVSEIAVTAGEGLKDFKVIYPIYGKLLKLGAKRDSLLIALGGGSVGDAAGFIAATYLRGIAWVGIPTTLLAQVDSSVGGKTGINHEIGKNLIGAFHQPKFVVCDLSTLKTLTKREIISGLGEAMKYGLVYDQKFFSFFRENWKDALGLEAKVLGRIVYESLMHKSLAVGKDEFDVKGIREFLNFGHTFGHAIETVTGYKKFQHGEAVFWGMRFAAALSFIRNQLTEKEFLIIDEFLRTIPLPDFKGTNLKSIFEVMRSDKKVRNGKIHFVLLKRIGKAVSDSKVSVEDLKNAAYLIGVWK